AYALIFKNQASNLGMYLLSIVLGSMSFSTVFTMVAAVSAKAGNNSTIMAILSFPVVIPLLIVLIKLSAAAVSGATLADNYARSAYALIFKNQACNLGMYLLSIVLGSMSFSTVFTMVAAVSAKAGNNSTIMAILSFPVVIPLLIVLIKLSAAAVSGATLADNYA